MTGTPARDTLRQIERRSIDFVPEDERHGRVSDQGPFWFISNFHFFAIAIGFVGPSLGLSLCATVLAGTLGTLIGTAFQAFHASQGPELGLPQMIQSRAQFGFRGVIVPLLGVLISLLGYNVVAAVLIANGAKSLWGIDRNVLITTIVASTALVAIYGHDWLHLVFRTLFRLSTPLFFGLSAAILLHPTGWAATAPHASLGFAWPAFLTQLAAAASFNITSAPFVSDYSRYLPKTTPRLVIVAQVFVGSAGSAIWLIVLGAWLATQLGASDALVALHQAGDHLIFGFGSILVMVSICALCANVAMNDYSSMLTFVTMMDCFRSVTPTRRLRTVVVIALSFSWAALAFTMGGDAIAYVNDLLVIMLYFLTPWTAVNLIDFFILRRGRYVIDDIFTPHGRYGAWGVRGLCAYAVGFAASAPFFVIPGLYTGPAAARIGGGDIGWLIGLAASSAAYLLATRLTRFAGLGADSHEGLILFEPTPPSYRLPSCASADPSVGGPLTPEDPS
jgi:purine-cytosine permease-like protein